jgi:hypothetical protein
MYRTDCDTAHPVLLNRLSKVNTNCGWPGRSSFISGELKGGEGYHILMSDWRAIMTPPEGHPGQHVYTFLIRILSTSLSSVSIFSVCCYSSESISMAPTPTFSPCPSSSPPPPKYVTCSFMVPLFVLSSVCVCLSKDTFHLSIGLLGYYT